MSEIKTGHIVEILPTRIWIEDDFCGGRHVMLQHEGMEPFCYASFHYDYAYTSNAGTWAMARQLALDLGAVEPIERKHRGVPTEGIGESRREPLTDHRCIDLIVDCGLYESKEPPTLEEMCSFIRTIEAEHGITKEQA